MGRGKAIALARTKVPKGAHLALPVSKLLSSVPLSPLKLVALSACERDYERDASYPPTHTPAGVISFEHQKSSLDTGSTE